MLNLPPKNCFLNPVVIYSFLHIQSILIKQGLYFLVVLNSIVTVNRIFCVKIIICCKHREQLYLVYLSILYYLRKKFLFIDSIYQKLLVADKYDMMVVVQSPHSQVFFSRPLQYLYYLFCSLVLLYQSEPPNNVETAGIPVASLILT